MQNELKNDLECIIADLWVLLVKDADSIEIAEERLNKDATLRSIHTVYERALKAYDKL